LDYERLTAEPETQIRRLLDFSGLPWDDSVLQFHAQRRPVLTASRFQVQEPIHRRATGRWRPYARHLATFTTAIRDILGEDHAT
jgi:hypothetical protein